MVGFIAEALSQLILTQFHCACDPPESGLRQRLKPAAAMMRGLLPFLASLLLARIAVSFTCTSSLHPLSRGGRSRGAVNEVVLCAKKTKKGASRAQRRMMEKKGIKEFDIDDYKQSQKLELGDGAPPRFNKKLEANIVAGVAAVSLFIVIYATVAPDLGLPQITVPSFG
uniref:Uncharacterized protein n=1 Tax=Chromera velia CCMP2878 TaxID=1169474 RepID=A0A0G4HGE5_9ALVE|eukprot:Cvel_6766.t1-p1 / transcript=Cvel_6766.t1 / gene=Cvel_6766 / organism=Chromera_velia_CCMP2878 / gene_product=hypothetical protein / transcript_product=hypothetical protein / location=Cvel_scaffold339:90301-90804(-) / protein_length=168 / sequence_SO=supercontig / SO=protein_coding / is_pseudo=false